MRLWIFLEKSDPVSSASVALSYDHAKLRATTVQIFSPSPPDCVRFNLAAIV